MELEIPKIKVKFYFPDETPVEYLLTEIDAMELEVYAITRVPKRLVRRILRVGENLQGEREVSMEYLLENSGSRSGDVYNALKYLEHNHIIEIRREFRKIKTVAPDKLDKLLNKIKGLLSKPR
ncbi:MAG: hypothetical protein HWN66_07395 [Candidatus Helarchaeota archaeon]|nr:hypothetical protein [Candidatus Helarchaeota archaeon]